MTETDDCAEIASPCNNVCRMDSRNILCEGCFRTVDEICAWGDATRAERLAMLAEIEARRLKLGL